MISFGEARYLATTPAKDLVVRHGHETARSFSGRDRVPVVIAARNEEDDLPRSLLAMSRSTVAVEPIVVVNGTDDETAERAQAMGARVVHCEHPFKLAALQLGTSSLIDDGHEGPILYTDADTFVGRRWAERMAYHASNEARTPVVALGGVAFFGSSLAFDVARSARLFVKNHNRVRLGSAMPAVGSNMAISFGGNQDAVEAYMSLPRNLFIGEEQAIVDTLVSRGGVVISDPSLLATVLTRNDRHNLLQLKRSHSATTAADLTASYPEYEGVVPYDRDKKLSGK